jgi:7-keto-8-aminopelargonate synthetase-like enzyme
MFFAEEDILPFYDVAAVAEAVGIDAKQLDNILSRNELSGVERRTRGVSRRLSVDAAVTIHLASEIASALGMPIGHALRISAAIQQDADYVVQAGEFATLRADVARIRMTTIARLDSAVELVGRRRRGRPSKTGRVPTLGA